MKNLYAPWRDIYTTGTARTNKGDEPQKSCIFCIQIAAHQDEKYFILKRYKHHVVMLNLYPYNAGHLLIVSYEHVPDLVALSETARAELMEISSQCTSVLYKALKADGINVGLNLGKAAGAGVPSHIHLHVLPRFTGDTNFMPTLAETKVISFDLHKIYAQLKEYFV